MIENFLRFFNPNTPSSQNPEIPADEGQRLGVTASDIKAIDEIFSSKGWDISQHSYEESYNSFLSMMEILNDEEKNLIITLAKSFNKYDEKKYGEYTYDCFSKIPSKAICKFKRVVFLPIKDPSKRSSYKSSDSVLISFKYTVCSYIDAFNGLETYYPNSTEEFLSNVDDGNIRVDADTLVIGVDDYIGSGRTADNFCNWLVDNMPLKKKQIMIVSIVCMQEALTLLRKKGYSVFCYSEEKKGITQNNDFSSKKHAFVTLRNITEYLKIDVDRYFKGYGESEALVSMINTPNNTFAIFWASKMKSGDPWPAPFKRVV